MKYDYYPENSTRIYHVWHGLKTDYHKHGVRKLELVEAYSGKEARQIVRDMYPGHSVGNPVLWKK